MRIVLETSDFQAVAFQVQEAELVGARELETRLARLGPDVLATQFDPQLAAARICAAGARPMCDVLLDQRVLAGLGNVYKSELLFLARVHPARLASGVDASAAQLIAARGAGAAAPERVRRQRWHRDVPRHAPNHGAQRSWRS